MYSDTLKALIGQYTDVIGGHGTDHQNKGGTARLCFQSILLPLISMLGGDDGTRFTVASVMF